MTVTTAPNNVHKVARLQYGDTPDARQWAEATITRLFMDQTGFVIGGLERTQPSGAEAGKEIGKLINYLATHKHRLDYQACRNTGLPIGSGGIESADKHIRHVRGGFRHGFHTSFWKHSYR